MSGTIDYEELRITKYVGRGDSGVLYDGEWQDRQVSIKFLGQGDTCAPRQPPSPSLTLKVHPNIAQVIGFSFRKDKEQHILIMENFKNAMNLNQFIAKRVKCKSFFDSPHIAMDVMHQIAEGLLFLHSNNVLHTALKPSNILINMNDEVKLVDFGLGSSYWDTDLDIGGACTRRYMAPELKGSTYHYTKASDIYSFSIVCSELLMGMKQPVRPFQSRSEHYFGCLPRLSCYPPALFELLHRSCESDPRLRPTMSEISHKLNAIRCRETSFEVRRAIMNSVTKQALWCNVQYPSTRILLQILSMDYNRTTDPSVIEAIGEAAKHFQMLVKGLTTSETLVRVQLLEALRILSLFLVKVGVLSQTLAYEEMDRPLRSLSNDHGHPNVINAQSVEGSGNSHVLKLMELAESQFLFTHEKTWLMLQLASAMRFLHKQQMYGNLNTDSVWVEVSTLNVKIYVQNSGVSTNNSSDAEAQDVLSFSHICVKLFNETHAVDRDAADDAVQGKLPETNLLLQCQCSGHAELAGLINKCSSDSRNTSFEMIHKTVSFIRACLALNCTMKELKEKLDKGGLPTVDEYSDKEVKTAQKVLLPSFEEAQISLNQ